MSEPQKSYMRLDLKQVERLLGDPAAASRCTVANKVADALADPQLTEHEQKLALDIVGVLIRDVEVSVRAAVSQGLQSSSLLPRAKAAFLAKDVEWVALPILRASPVLQDEDLIDIIGAGNLEKQVAIAGRVSVSSVVSGALVDTGVEEVVRALLDNPGADISDSMLHRVLHRFPDNPSIQEGVIDRPRLPLTVIADLIGNVEEVLRRRLIDHHKLPGVLVEALLRLSREEVLVAAVQGDDRSDQVEELAARLEKDGTLTFSLLLRALLTGDVAFFEAGMACRARMSRDKARVMLLQRGRDGFQRLYRKTAFPGDLLEAFWLCFEEAVASHGQSSTPAAVANGPHRRMVRRLAEAYPQVRAVEVDEVIAELTRLYGGDEMTIWR